MKSISYFSNLFACFCALLILGCARMAVDVDVLNSAYWASPGYSNSGLLAHIIFIEEKISTGQFAMDCEGLKEEVNQKKNLEDSVRKQLCEKIDKAYHEAKLKYQNAFNEVSTQGKLTQAARDSYATASKSLLSIREEISKLEKEKTAEAIKARTAADTAKAHAESIAAEAHTAKAEAAEISATQMKELGKTTNATLSGYILDAGIRDDPRASAAVNAPKQYWEGKFNQTLCNGWFGNTDCAVKMEDLGDFSIKGVRLDAANITNATFSVATEAIQIAAAIYGIPVPKAQPKGDGQANMEDVSPVKRQRDAETAILQLRLARLAMFETIVAQRQAIKDKKSRDQAIITIKKALEENSKLLDPSTAQPQPGN